MFKIDDKVVYKGKVCSIISQNEDSYTLIPIEDKSLKIIVKKENASFRNLLTKEEIMNLIDKMPSVEEIDISDKMLEQEYKRLMATGNHLDLIKIIKTTYKRNKTRLDNKKKIGDKDNNYFLQAENLLYTEFKEVLDMSYDEVKNYIIKKLNN